MHLLSHCINVEQDILYNEEGVDYYKYAGYPDQKPASLVAQFLNIKGITTLIILLL